MRILITTSTFPHRLDEGLPRFVNDLAESLAERMEVTVLAPDSPGAAAGERVGRVEVRRFTYFRPRRLQRLALGQGMRDNLRTSTLARLQVPAFLLRQGLETRRLVRTGRFDLVFAHWIVPQGLTSAWAVGKGRRVPLVVHVHGGDAYLLRELPRGRSMARYIVSRCDAVFASGSGVRDCLDRVLGYASGAAIRPMGVHTETFRRGQGVLVGARGSRVVGDDVPDFPDGFVLFVGRMIQIKGCEHLIRAMPSLLADRPGLGLVLVGDGPERPRLEAEVDRQGLRDRVAFLGRRPHSDVVRCLHRCRVLAVPSVVDAAGRTEGMPTTVIEGMAAGCRVVATAVGGIPDVIRHGENGWLCRDRDSEDLVEKMGIALDDPPESGALEAAVATAASHDWRAVASTYADCFERLVEGRHAR